MFLIHPCIRRNKVCWVKYKLTWLKNHYKKGDLFCVSLPLRRGKLNADATQIANSATETFKIDVVEIMKKWGPFFESA